MNPLRANFQLDKLHCIDEADGPGDAEPFLWVVLFKIDGDTCVVDDSYHLAGTATVITRAGDHGDLPNQDVGADTDVPIAGTLGAYGTILKPIPLRTPLGDITEVGGAIGCVAVLLEQDNTPDDAIAKGHAALNDAVTCAIAQILPTLGATKTSPSQMDIDGLSDKVQQAVTDAVKSAVSVGDWIIGLGNMDDVIGFSFFSVSHDQLAGAPAAGVPFSQWWIERSAGIWGPALAGGSGPTFVGSFRPGRYDKVLGMIASVSLPRGWRLIAYPSPGFAGTPRVFGDGGVGAEIASFEIDMGQVVLFDHAGYSGAQTALSEPGRHDVGELGGVGNDRAASIRVPDGWRVTAYSEGGFWGDTATYTDDSAITGALAGRLSSVVLERADAHSGDGDWQIFGHAWVSPEPRHTLDAHWLAEPTANVPSTVTVIARDTVTNQPVAGRVLVNGADVAATNTPFTHTFRARIEQRTVFLPGDGLHSKPRKVTVNVLVWLDKVTVRAAGFPDAAVPLHGGEIDP